MFGNHSFRFGMIFSVLALAVLIAFAIPIATLAAGPSPQTAPLPIVISPEFLSAVAAVIASLAFAYVPGLKTLYAKLTDEWKAAVMGITLVAIAGAAFGIGCAQLLPELQVSCDRNGVITIIYALVAALTANQATYQLAVKPFKQNAEQTTSSTISPSDPLATLALGTPVVYTAMRGTALADFAAIVTHIWGPTGTVNLYVLPDGGALPPAQSPTSVRYDPDGSAGTWHFPTPR